MATRPSTSASAASRAAVPTPAHFAAVVAGRRRGNRTSRGGAVEHNGRVTASAHPEPTPATVKRLYARAFRCARPDCSRPLYKQDNDTGDLALNSRVAHIHARRPGGPRWIEMHPEDNRADANLLLLCIEHSYEVDELPDLYPAELLREWKQAQLDEHEQAQRGWPLTDADAGRVLEASSRAVDHHHAGAVLGAVRAAERLALAARGARRGPAAQAAAWRAGRARVRNAFTAWDKDGNALHAEPSRHETEQHKAALLAALEEAVEALAPLANESKVELAAVGRAAPLSSRGPPGRPAPSTRSSRRRRPGPARRGWRTTTGSTAPWPGSQRPRTPSPRRGGATRPRRPRPRRTRDRPRSSPTRCRTTGRCSTGRVRTRG